MLKHARTMYDLGCLTVAVALFLGIPVPKTANQTLDMLTAWDQWVINHAAYPGLFSIAFAIFLGTVILPRGLQLYNYRQNRKNHRHFKCDLEALKLVCPLMAQIKEDACGYALYSEDMGKRIQALKALGGYFLDSQYASNFNLFFTHAGLIIAGKSSVAIGKMGLTLEEKMIAAKELDANYKILKQALDHDYACRSQS